MAISQAASKCHLEPANLQDPVHFTELHEQRIICGWDDDTATLQRWKHKQIDGVKSLFWITLPAPAAESDQIKRVGHIALDAYSDPLDPDIARADKSVLTVHSLFILPESRAYGLGRRVMDLLEEMATRAPYGSPACRWITLCGLSKRHVYDDGPEWRGVWARLGQSPPSFSIQEWYEKLDYEVWKERPLYEVKALDGQTIPLWEDFMRYKLLTDT